MLIDKRLQRQICTIVIFLVLFYPTIKGIPANNYCNDLRHTTLPILNVSDGMNDVRDDIEKVLSITHHDPNKAQEGLTLFTLWRVSDPEVEYFIDSAILAVDMEGNIEFLLKFPIAKDLGLLVWDPEFINSTTFVYIMVPSNLLLYNIQTNKTEILPVLPGHHDVEYNPLTDTFLTVHFTQYGYYLDKALLFDDIREFDRDGNEVWYWNSSIHIPFNETLFTMEEFYNRYQWTHANTIFWDIEEQVIYYNARHLDTFYKIDYPSGEIIWAAGKLGNLKMFDKHGNEKQSLFYHGHAVEVIAKNRFIIHDNDYFNTSRDNPEELVGIPRMIEVVINEETMTMNETWSWAAPAEYFGEVWGDADRLPNGNRLGTFGVPRHPAYITEVDTKDEIVWELAIEQGFGNYWGIFNADRFFEAPLVEINQTDYTVNSTEDLVLQVRTWDTYDTRTARDGTLTITEGENVLESFDFKFQPHWQETNLYVNISSKGNGERTLALTITNEDDLSTRMPITVNGGATTEPASGWSMIPLFLSLIAYTVSKRKKRKYSSSRN